MEPTGLKTREDKEGAPTRGVSSIRRVALASMFGVIIFLSKIFVPTPFDKMVILPQAVLLTLSSLILYRLGGTSSATVGGLLTTIWRPSFAPFSLLFAILYGVLIDLFVALFRSRSPAGDVSVKRVVLAASLATMVTGFISYSLTVYVLAMMPANLIVDAAILVGGFANGFVAGLIAVFIWKRIKKIV